MENQSPKPISKLKCKDCGTFSIEVRKNAKFNENLCVDCFLTRVIKEAKTEIE